MLSINRKGRIDPAGSQSQKFDVYKNQLIRAPVGSTETHEVMTHYMDISISKYKNDIYYIYAFINSNRSDKSLCNLLTPRVP